MAEQFQSQSLIIQGNQFRGSADRLSSVHYLSRPAKEGGSRTSQAAQQPVLRHCVGIDFDDWLFHAAIAALCVGNRVVSFSFSGTIARRPWCNLLRNSAITSHISSTIPPPGTTVLCWWWAQPHGLLDVRRVVGHAGNWPFSCRPSAHEIHCKAFSPLGALQMGRRLHWISTLAHAWKLRWKPLLQPVSVIMTPKLIIVRSLAQ